MLKNISNLGTILSKEDQKSVNGGLIPLNPCTVPHIALPGLPCPTGHYRANNSQCCPGISLG